MFFGRRWFMTYRKQLINFGNYMDRQNTLNPLKFRTALVIYAICQFVIALFIFKNAGHPIIWFWFCVLMVSGFWRIGKAHSRAKHFEQCGKFLFESVFLFAVNFSILEGMVLLAYYESLFAPFIVFLSLAFGLLFWIVFYMKKKIEQMTTLDYGEKKVKHSKIPYVLPGLVVVSRRVSKYLLTEKTQTVIFMFCCAFCLFGFLLMCFSFFLVSKGLQFAEEDSNAGVESNWQKQRSTQF